MKKLFAIGAFVFGVTMFAQAQSSATTPKKSTQITEAPRPSGGDVRTDNLSTNSPTTTPSTSTRSAENAPAGSTDAAPAATRGTNTTPSTRVLSPDNTINVDGRNAAPRTQPVVKPNTTITPKH